MDGSKSSATLGLTTRPSGSTTTKNCFTVPATLNFAERSFAMEKSPLAISERVRLPNEMWRRIFEIANTIAATITDNTNKTMIV